MYISRSSIINNSTCKHFDFDSKFVCYCSKHKKLAVPLKSHTCGRFIYRFHNLSTQCQSSYVNLSMVHFCIAKDLRLYSFAAIYNCNCSRAKSSSNYRLHKFEYLSIESRVHISKKYIYS